MAECSCNPSIEKGETVTPGSSLLASLAQWQALVQWETCLKAITWRVREEDVGHPALTSARTSVGQSMCTLMCVQTHPHKHTYAHTIHHTPTLNKTESIPIRGSLYVQKWTFFFLVTWEMKDAHLPALSPPHTDSFSTCSDGQALAQPKVYSLYQTAPCSVPRHLSIPQIYHLAALEHLKSRNGGDWLWRWRGRQKTCHLVWGLPQPLPPALC